MVHVLNLAMKCDLKELGNDKTYLDSVDYEEHIKGLKAISQKKFHEILHRLRNLIIVVNHSPKKIHHYKNLCEELEMSNKNISVEDVHTKLNSTHDMTKVAWEKRKVLKAMLSNHIKTKKQIFNQGW